MSFVPVCIVLCILYLCNVINYKQSQENAVWRWGICFWSCFSKFLPIAAFPACPRLAGGEAGRACVHVCVCVCHRLRLFIGGEKQITMQKFISCLTHTGFELRVGLGAPGHGAAGRSLARCMAGGRVLEMNFRDVAFTFNKELIGRRVRIDYNCDSLFKVIS